MRTASITRDTKETKITVSLNLDGSGTGEISTGVGFFDHMLDHLSRHGLLDMTVRAEGDLHVDPHHTVEDVGICLGKALIQAVGEPKGITRYGHAVVPMDETLAEATVDFSGRPFVVFRADLPPARVGEFDAELAEEFFRALAVNARLTLHVELRYGKNVHHCLEGMFKAVARAIRQALEKDPRVTSVPSTKGMLEA